LKKELSKDQRDFLYLLIGLSLSIIGLVSLTFGFVSILALITLMITNYAYATIPFSQYLTCGLSFIASLVVANCAASLLKKLQNRHQQAQQDQKSN
jgi:hypothetical protein